MNEAITNGRPFARAAAMYMQVLALRERFQHDLAALRFALSGVPEYRSRGHGRTPRRMARTNFYPRPSKYQPHQGKSEAARRLFQALPKAQRAYIRSIEGEVTA